MKLLKNILFSLFIALSSLGVSSVAIAAPSNAEIAISVDNVSVKITEALKAIDEGVSKEDVLVLLKSAGKLVNKIPQGDNIDIKRNRANTQLRKARSKIKKGKLDAAKKHLEKAAKGFSDLNNALK